MKLRSKHWTVFMMIGVTTACSSTESGGSDVAESKTPKSDPAVETATPATPASATPGLLVTSAGLNPTNVANVRALSQAAAPLTASVKDRTLELIRRSEYAVRSNHDGLRAFNRAHRLEAIWRAGATRVSLPPRKLTVDEYIEATQKAAAGKGKDPDTNAEATAATFTLTTRAVSRGEQRVAVPESEFKLGACQADGAKDLRDEECLHRAESSGNALTEWWENRAEGLEQGFDVKERLSGTGALTIELEVGNGTVSLDKDGQEAKIELEDGKVVHYGQLSTRDAAGRSLATRLVESENGFAIEVDDEGAQYPITVDPLIVASPLWTGEGNQDNASYGYAIASAGDVNNDGYGDVIVGAPFYSNPQTNEGCVKVYHGTPTGVSPTPATNIESNLNGALFGISITGPGDMDRDNFADLVVGTPFYTNGETAEGGVWGYKGSVSGIVSAPAGPLQSNQINANLGRVVSGGGDVDGDGYPDFVVSAPLYNNPESDEGKIWLVRGNSTFSFALTGGPEGNIVNGHLGGSVAIVGDTNGDGKADVVVGSPDHPTSNKRAMLFQGTSAGINASEWTRFLTNAFTSQLLGQSVASAGDINGDGLADVVVGAPGFDNGKTDEGAIFVYQSPFFSGTSQPLAWVEGEQDNARYGSTVAPGGDVNGDGMSDVLASSYLYDNPNVNEGVAALYKGMASGPVAKGNLAEGDADDQYGYSVEAAGDVNGDGYDDLIVGAPFAGSVNGGRAYVLVGPSFVAAAWTLNSTTAEGTGISVAGAGDVDGDGFADVVVGSPSYSNGQAQEGRVRLFRGSASGTLTSPTWSPESNLANTSFGQSVASAGDVNGDGYPDLLVGAPAFDGPSLTNNGRAYLYLATGNIIGYSSSPAWTFDGPHNGALLGFKARGNNLRTNAAAIFS